MDRVDLNSAINWDEVDDQYTGHAQDMHYEYVLEESDGGTNWFFYLCDFTLFFSCALFDRFSMCKPTTEDEGEEQNNGGRDDNDYVHGADEAGGSGGHSERADEHAQGGRSNSAGPSHSHHTQDDEHAQGGRTTNHNCGRIRLGLSGRGRENSGRGRGVQVVGRGSVQVTNGGSLHVAGGGPGAPVRGRLGLAGRKRPHPGTIQWQPGHSLDAGRGRGRGVTSHLCRGRRRLGVDGLGRGRRRRPGCCRRGGARRRRHQRARCGPAHGRHHLRACGGPAIGRAHV